MGLLFYMCGHDITTYGLMFKFADHPGSLNCQCDLVAHSSPTMDPFAHGDTITLIFFDIYEIYFDISDPHELCYRVMKVLHEIGKKIHGLIHAMTTCYRVFPDNPQ